MSIDAEVKHKMESTLEHLKQDFRNLRTGRPNPGLLDTVLVEVYGSMMKIKELANVSASDRQLVVTPFDPQTSGPIAKGIEKANLNLKPIIEGGVIRMNVPPLTEQMRKEIVKQAKKRAEDCKIIIRGIRQKGNEAAKKAKADGDIPEDVQKKLEKKIQEHTDFYCAEIDKLTKAKEEEILRV